MIEYIEGKIIDKYNNNFLIIKFNNIGLRIYVNNKIYLKYNKLDKIKLYTYLKIKNEDIIIFGFETIEERNFFNKLIKIRGINYKLALNILSYYTINQIYEIINNKDINSLKKIPLIGEKIAKNLIFNLSEDINFYLQKKDNSNLKDLYYFLIDMGLDKLKAKNIINQLKNLENENYEKLLEKALKILNNET